MISPILTASRTDRVGPYRLERELGAGGMGQVYQAYDERLDRRVAIKQIRPDQAADPKRRARLRREAWAAARLTHPYIVQIFDIVESEDGDWIVMELVDGSSLRELLRSGPVSVADTLRWGQQVAEGLAEAHDKGIIHRDLKTENVMISASGNAKILDFGLAKALWGREEAMTLSMEGFIIGTVRAMSPEQARGLPIDHRSDLFSLGVMFHEMLSSGSPFEAASAADSLSRVLTLEPPSLLSLNPQVPRGLSILVQDLLEKDPKLRPASARAVAARLSELATVAVAAPKDLTVSLRPARAAGDPRPAAAEAGPASVSRTRARKVRWAATAAVALAAIALAVVWLSAGTRWDVRSWFGGGAVGEGSAERQPALGVHELYQEATELMRRYDRVGNLDRAIELLERALAQDEKSAAVHAGLAQAYWLKYFSESKDRSWLDRALPVAERAVSLDQHLSAARISRGTVYTAVGRYDEAERDFNYVLVLDPGNADAYRGLGEVAELKGEFGAAEQALKKAIALRPDDREFLDHLGHLYYKLGRYKEAESAYQTSIEAAPDSPYGYRNLAAAYYMQGRNAEAAGQLQKALEIRPEASSYRNLGVILFSQGLYQEAATAFEKALEFSEGANDYVYWANLGDAQRWLPGKENEARRAYLRALQLLRQQLEERPDDVTLLSRQALYLAKRGECDKASGDLERLGKLAASDPGSVYRSAVAFEVCKQRERALDALGRALKAGYSIVEVRTDPELLALREDPRYHRLAMDYETGS
jgi:eukaryotic-like serine/threonine-protein kinase